MKSSQTAMLIIILSLSLFSFFPTAKSEATLAESLNTWLNGVSWTNRDLMTTHYGVIFSKLETSAYDTLASYFISGQDWTGALHLKRVAELSGYSSSELATATLQALGGMRMVGYLPSTQSDGAFCVYNRYLLNGYRWAQQIGGTLTTKWNGQAAFQQLAKLVDKYGGGFLFAYSDTAQYTDQPNTRYYDEQAETLGCFRVLEEGGISGARVYEDKIWAHLNDDGWWTGQWYWYRPAWKCFECEMGAFALIITDYLGSPHSNIVSDLNEKLLKNGWNSPSWQPWKYIINHANNPDGGAVTSEVRPWETVTAWEALHVCYPSFTATMKTTMQNMLTQNPTAWQEVLYMSGYKGSSDRQLSGAMVMFLNGIVPNTGSLDIPLNEERYDGLVTDFPSGKFRFNYANKMIRIPVKSGSLKFLFGSQPVTRDFQTGTWNIYFANDWNSIVKVEAVSSSGNGGDGGGNETNPTNWWQPIIDWATTNVIQPIQNFIGKSPYLIAVPTIGFVAIVGVVGYKISHRHKNSRKKQRRYALVPVMDED